jgi:hypothetical protein
MKKLFIFTLILFLPVFAFSQEGDDLSQQIQNPVASLISVPFQNNTNLNLGVYDRTQNILNIQPVVPIQLSKNINMIVRVIAPIIWQPIGKDDTKTGLGDIIPTFFFTPAKSGKIIWGIGPVFSLNTATDRVLGYGKWGAGPSFVVLTQPSPWTIGLLANNIWSFAGQYDRQDFSSFLAQVFVTLNLPNGWYVNSAPIITSNWIKVTDDKWSSPNWVIPVGAGFGKLHMFGKLPVNMSLSSYYNIVRPTNGSDIQIRAQVSIVLPGF